MKCFAYLICLIASFALLLGLAAPVKAEKTSDPQSGELGNEYFGISFTIEGLDSYGISTDDSQASINGTPTGPSITVRGSFRIFCEGPYVREYSAKILAESSDNAYFESEKTILANRSWDYSLDSRETEDIKKEILFHVVIPVPQYVENQTTVVDFTISLVMFGYDHRFGADVPPMETYAMLHVFGSAHLTVIEPPKEPIAKPTLTITNGDPNDPQRGSLTYPLMVNMKLMDPSTNPPTPIKGAVIKVDVPIRGSKTLTTAGNEIEEVNDDQRRVDKYWTLDGSFCSVNNTEFLNCIFEKPAFGSAKGFYQLKDPRQLIEVMTNEKSEAGIEFFLDFNALGRRVPRRAQPLIIPVNAEYIVIDEETGGKTLVRANHLIEMKYMGIIESITCIEPQRFKNSGGITPYFPLPFTNSGFPLVDYLPVPKGFKDLEGRDSGTPPPFEKVYGADRVMFTPYIVALADSNQSNIRPEIQREAMPSRPVKKGMLFSFGDQIRIDARGLVRYNPNTKNQQEFGKAPVPGKLGWIWVRLRFFDGLNAKVGISGEFENELSKFWDDRHTLTFGHTPEETGWVPSTDAWVNLVIKEGKEEALSRLNPVLGTVDAVGDVDGLIKWANNRKPVYLRLNSELHVSHKSDGSTVITVREGQPVVLTPEAPPDGILVEPGSTMTLGSGGEISVRPSSPEEIARAEELLGDLRKPHDSNLEPIEVEFELPPAAPPAAPESPPPPPVEETPAEDSPLNWVEQFIGHYPLTSPSSSWLMANKCPPMGMSLSCRLNYSQPGVVLDTVGLNSAASGNWAMSVQPDGRLCFQVFSVDSSNRAGWYRFVSQDSLSAGKDYWINIEVSDGEFIAYISDEADNDTVMHEVMPCRLATDPVYAGDFPGDDWWGESYNIHPAATGQLDVYYFGPKISMSSPETFAGSYVIR